ncbi:MAG: hypothetical protein AAGD11_08810 [Planctomycetota bacterium]
MWLNRMFRDRQEIFVLGEIVLFLGAWGLCVAAAVDDYRARSNDNAENNVASNLDVSGQASPQQRGAFE